MTSIGYALARAELLRTLTAYVGITTEKGAADGTTLIDSRLIDRNDFISEKTVLIMSGDAKDENKGAKQFDNGTGTIILKGDGFSAQIKAGTPYRILNISTVEFDVANINSKIGTNTDPAGTTTLFAWLANLFGILKVPLSFKDQWCASPIASLAFSNVAADKDFADVVFPAGFLPAGAVVDAVFLMVHWRKQVDTSAAANAVNGVNKRIRVKKSTGTWGTDDVVGITMADNSLATAGSATEGGTIIIGDVDIKGEADDVDNETYNIRSEQTNRADAIVVDGASLTLYDVYTGLRVYYHV